MKKNILIVIIFLLVCGGICNKVCANTLPYEESSNPLPAFITIQPGSFLNYSLSDHYTDDEQGKNLTFTLSALVGVEPFLGDTSWFSLGSDGVMSGTVPAEGKEYNAEFTVSDGAGGETDIQTLVLKKPNTPPYAETALPSSLAISPGEALNFSLLDYYNDAEQGKNLTFTLSALLAVDPFLGDTSWFSLGSDGVMSGTVPAEGKEYNAEFTVSDGAGGVTDIQTLVLKRTNTPPYAETALPSSLAISPGEALNFSLLDYYNDAEQGKNLTFTLSGLIGVDPFMGDTSWFTLAANGVMGGTVPADGKEYNAEFTVSDGAGGVTDIQNLVLKAPAPNTPPYASGLPSSVAISPGESLSFFLLDYYNDAEQGKNLTFTLSDIIGVDPFFGDTSWFSLGSDGVMSGVVPADGREYNADFTVSDGAGGVTALQNIVLKAPAPNTPPYVSVQLPSSVPVTPGAALSFSLLDYYNDAEQGKNLTFTLSDIIGVDPFFGDTSWFSLGSDGVMSGVVPADGKEYNAEFTVSDGAGGVTDIQSITLSKVNPAGDFNCNAEIDLGDAIIGLQILVSIEPAEQFCYSNIAGEDNIGLADVICILQDIAKLKN